MTLAASAQAFFTANGLQGSNVAAVTISGYLAEPWWSWTEFLVAAQAVTQLPRVNPKLQIFYNGGSTIIGWDSRTNSFAFNVRPGLPPPLAARLIV